MYSEEEDTPRIVEVEDNGLDFLLDVDGLADPYMDLYVVQLTLVTGIKPTVPLSVIDKENSLESSLHWSIYLYTIYLVCALIIPHSQPNYV